MLFFVIPNASEESTAWMLRCAQHDKSGKRGCCTWHDKVGMAKLTLWSLSLQKERGWQPHPVALRRPSPSQGEGRFGESQNRVRSHSLPSTFFVIPNASEESTAWMLRCAQHDRTESVIPNASEESAHGCFTALCALFNMTRAVSISKTGALTKQDASFITYHFTSIIFLVCTN